MLALPVPRVPRPGLAARNRVHQTKAPLALPGPLSLHLVPVSGAEPWPGETLRVEGQAVFPEGTQDFALLLPAVLPQLLVNSFADDVAEPTLPASLRGLLLEAALLDMVEALEAAWSARITFTRTAPTRTATADPARTPAHGFLLRTVDQSWPLALDCTDALAGRIMGSWPAGRRNMDWLPFRAEPVLGGVCLPLRVVASLRTGDVLLAEPALDRDAARLVLPGGFGADMARINAEWMLTEMPGPMDTMDDADAGPMEAGPGTGEEGGLDDIPVRLEFGLGQIEIPLARLREMGPGTVLDLGRGLGDAVTVSANGRRIGRGELVDVDGVLGVRITRIAGHE